MCIIRLGKFIILILMVELLTGCASSSVVSRSDPSSNTYNLTSAKVTWVKKSTIPITLGVKRFTSYVDQELTAKKKFSQLLSLFQQRVSSQVSEQLALNNVGDGNEVFLQIAPVSAEMYYGKMNGISQKFVVRASISDAVSIDELWYITVSLTEDFDETDQMILDNYVAILMTELKSAGWIR